ncbi:8-amino-7-oxononanoate synthase [Mesorhizobium sp.]|uniref:8-amino-7-oxononanoate synthase n=1 Tax=Mesorhizobium sp. TaxID=1871066 RepID=UPI0012131C06|nr:8-amino-7-oxononanoate synthase [Mesorhizobium sp.]TIO26776.1 MAG: 8-amino-7-oxononanoate synthase [Mesorhizobium sp.]
MTASGPLLRYEAKLRGLARKNRLRSLSPRAGLDFASNDYLGLAASPRLAGAVAAALAAGTPVGATGSRLLRGNAPEHEQLEAAAARFFGAERALFFGSGYVANFALLTTLPRWEDLLIMDELVHASAHEAARAGRAQKVEVPHNDVGVIENVITAWRGSGGTGRVWIAVESLNSMDGDRAPLAELAALADRHGAFLVIDEAHATGLFGPHGRGLAHALEGRENVIVLHTCGKALGCSGALVTAPAVLCDYLVNRCRPFIYATAPSPLMAVAASEALDILRDEPERRDRLAQLVAFAGSEMHRRCGIEPSGSQIIPVIIGNNARTMAVAAALQARGFDVRGIRPPTVPEGTARLRVSLTLNVGEAEIAAMVEALAEEWERIKA